MTPCISWGFGHSPVLKDRPHSMLAVAWGPLVQLIVLIDHEETDNPFIQDGYYILRNFNLADQSIIKQPKIRKSVRFSIEEQNLQEDEDDVDPNAWDDDENVVVRKKRDAVVEGESESDDNDEEQDQVEDLEDSSKDKVDGT